MTVSSSANANNDAPSKKLSGWRVFAYFFVFFVGITVVNIWFVYTAVTTNTGLVTDNPYEKGLAYNEVLETAKNQPQITENATFENGVITWSLRDENGAPINNAKVKTTLFRAVQDGYDTTINLEPAGEGIYTATAELPKKGLWIAKLNATWNTQSYQTTQKFIIK